MSFFERIKSISTSGDLFPELTSADKKYGYIAAKIAVDIRNKRKELNLTQKEFADMLGVSQGMISKWESADYNFSIENLVHLYDKLNIYISIREKSPKNNITVFKRSNNLWKFSNDKVKSNLKETGASA